MSFHLPEVVAKLGEGVGFWLQPERGQDGLVNLRGAPTADLRTAVKKDFHQADHTGVLNADPWYAGTARSDR